MKLFYDVDTQNDFMNKNGALYVPDAELIKPNLKQLTQYALKNKIAVIGSVDRHFKTEEYKERETELQRWGGPFPDHCMAGTIGELKINETLLWYPIENPDHYYRERDIYIPHELDNSINRDLLYCYSSTLHLWNSKNWGNVGIYFEKQSYDVLTNPAFEEFIYMKINKSLAATKAKITKSDPSRFLLKEALIYGVATDYCVKAAVLGMQKRNIQCYVVEDAIKGVDPGTTKSALEEMTKAGAKFVTTKEVLEGKI
jgi:nicotinamidase/pyrazinamidase